MKVKGVLALSRTRVYFSEPNTCQGSWGDQESNEEVGKFIFGETGELYQDLIGDCKNGEGIEGIMDTKKDIKKVNNNNKKKHMSVLDKDTMYSIRFVKNLKYSSILTP